MMQKHLVFPALALAAVLGGCQTTANTANKLAYKVDIQQGNVITQDMVSKLHAGMTQAQVRYVLGSPLVTDPFHPERWDYVYTLGKGGKISERKRLTVIFADNKLARLEGDVTLDDASLKADAQVDPATGEAPLNTPMALPNAGPAPAQPLSANGNDPLPVAAPAPAAAAPAPAPAPAAPAEAKKEDKGFFGRMMEKIGF